MLPIQTFANCLSHWKNKDLHFLWRNLHLSVWVSYKGKALNVLWSIYLTQVCSFILQTLSWLFMCFQWLTCFAVKLATEQIRQIFFFFWLPHFHSIFLSVQRHSCMQASGGACRHGEGESWLPFAAAVWCWGPWPSHKAGSESNCLLLQGGLLALPSLFHPLTWNFLQVVPSPWSHLTLTLCLVT